MAAPESGEGLNVGMEKGGNDAKVGKASTEATKYVCPEEYQNAFAPIEFEEVSGLLDHPRSYLGKLSWSRYYW